MRTEPLLSCAWLSMTSSPRGSFLACAGGLGAGGLLGDGGDFGWFGAPSWPSRRVRGVGADGAGVLQLRGVRGVTAPAAAGPAPSPAACSARGAAGGRTAALRVRPCGFAGVCGSSVLSGQRSSAGVEGRPLELRA